MIDFIDLFAGLGGIRIGFTQAANDLGLETRCVFTSEIKESALCALNHNFPGENIIKRDITKVASNDIPHFNILLGGFPCQAFSFAGKQRGYVPLIIQNPSDYFVDNEDWNITPDSYLYEHV